jgi:mannosyltransferase
MGTQRTSRQANRQEVLTTGLLFLILLLALGLRCYGLDAQSLWNDEGTSVALAQRDLVTIARDAARDIHPPLYYWLLGGWVRLAGTSEAAVRSLSVLLGVSLVALTYVLGRLLVGRWIGLAAALLAAINPFQVYYSQEARMYMLVAVVAAGAMLALICFVKGGSWLALPTLVLLEAVGLYTHYSFVFVILILNLAYALQLRSNAGAGRVWLWMISQAAVVVIYLPWLPTAVRQVTAWPTPTQATAFLPALAHTWRWLVFGPTIGTEQVVVPLLLTALLVVFGLLSLGLGWVGKSTPHNLWVAGLLVLWVGLPVVLMFALGLYREAYLKFLLVTAPAVSLLLACGLLSPQSTAPHTAQHGPRLTFRASRFTLHVSHFTLYVLRLGQIIGALSILAGSALALRNYYTDPAYARDDYRRITAYIDAVGHPGDAVVLNAPGQQEVFGYYYEGDLPVHSLPESRPLDRAATESALVELAEPGGRVFAVLWATDESDPDRFVEGWLDDHAYKALDSWYGNVRLVVYAIPERTPTRPDHTPGVPLTSDETGDEIVLLGYSTVDDELGAGDIAQITLFWQADQPLSQRYKVFLHVLDEGNHIVGQRDAEPGGGARLTILWQPGEMIADNHGVPIHPATPPGEYRVEVGMYHPETGRRLAAPDGSSQLWLKPLTVVRPSAPAPTAALGMQHAADALWGELALLGYDAYKLGFAHQPDVVLQPGDVVHVNLYWRAEPQPTGDWQMVLGLVDSDGQEWVGIAAEPVGGYPTSHWQAGDVWRGQFNLILPGDAPGGQYWLQVQMLAPDGTSSEALLSEPLRVGP